MLYLRPLTPQPRLLHQLSFASVNGNISTRAALAWKISKLNFFTASSNQLRLIKDHELCMTLVYQTLPGANQTLHWPIRCEMCFAQPCTHLAFICHLCRARFHSFLSTPKILLSGDGVSECLHSCIPLLCKLIRLSSDSFPLFKCSGGLPVISSSLQLSIYATMWWNSLPPDFRFTGDGISPHLTKCQ